ncbi:unnamed protein product [Heligmosomoides polygyrus]|uniref:RRM domain-containing protein n=1 Tax=Heligmosomoides polygyrus TaxID=6339 RepID=A0A183GDT8_HELPZ|nr:unnamed protein product [Heligmosomoides polygyrus]
MGHASRSGDQRQNRLRPRDRPRGFGFCEFADQAGADNAVNALNGTNFNGPGSSAIQRRKNVFNSNKVEAVLDSATKSSALRED